MYFLTCTLILIICMLGAGPHQRVVDAPPPCSNNDRHDECAHNMTFILPTMPRMLVPIMLNASHQQSHSRLYGRAELRANQIVRRLAQSPGGLNNIPPRRMATKLSLAVGNLRSVRPDS